jgi:hypothetical protein
VTKSQWIRGGKVHDSLAQLLPNVIGYNQHPNVKGYAVVATAVHHLHTPAQVRDLRQCCVDSPGQGVARPPE